MALRQHSAAPRALPNLHSPCRLKQHPSPLNGNLSISALSINSFWDQFVITLAQKTCYPTSYISQLEIFPRKKFRGSVKLNKLDKLSLNSSPFPSRVAHCSLEGVKFPQDAIGGRSRIPSFC